MSFSTMNSGDWIDFSAAKATGSTATKIMMVKERGVNLLNPEEGDPKQIREREAITVYYKNLIRNAIDSIKKEFKKDQSTIELPDKIPWIISGGTSLAKNFLPLFQQEFNKIKDNFPISVSEIRMAADPLNGVAKGLLIAAMND
jgi:Ethanolamine utilization protein EutJ (predicted chaperonin)